MSVESLATTVLEPPTPSHIRAELADMLVHQLMGPVGGEHEEILEDPRQRYLIGMLAPQQLETPAGKLPDHLESEPGEPLEEGEPEQAVARSLPMFEPAAYGMSFTVAKSAPGLVIEANYGCYKRTESDTGAPTDSADGRQKVWARLPVKGRSEPLALQACDQVDVPLHYDAVYAQTDVKVRISMREHSECWVITVFLLNHQPPQKLKKSEAYLFQTRLAVFSPDGAAVFLKRMEPTLLSRLDARDLAEKQAMNMLYRHQLEFAVGHGISVHAELAEPAAKAAIRLETRVVPAFEVPITQHYSVPGLVTDMQELGEMPAAQLTAALMPLAEAYQQWCQRLQLQLEQNPEVFAEFGDAPLAAIARCQLTQQRILEGIELLQQDPQASKAFQFANRAMHMQRVHALWVQSKRRGEADSSLKSVDIPNNRSWRVFQLAFILLNLPGLTRLEHPERSAARDATADLLWFPTGGGKTEAYLGLSAYTLFLRRLQGTVAGRNGIDGVAVLMRYTLRLLTLQQFQRACALICACEQMRKADPETWGLTPFRIGLWVGQNTTPNRTKDSHEYIEAQNGSYQQKQALGGKASPLQLSECPWCGHSLEAARHIKVEAGFPSERGRTLTFCGDLMCPFSQRLNPKEGLPVVVVDEELYRLLPALVIATVDKFAQMPWNGQVQMLFGQVSKYCPRHGYRSPETKDKDRHQASAGFPAVQSVNVAPLRPPDLIIQDEFHLISGPLGSMVGLYETAVDSLCTWQVNGQWVRPKIILSTATIRRAVTQVREVFNRDVQIFPPHGLDIQDNFFSRQLPPTPERPGRLYLGLCAPGRKVKELQIHVYAFALAAAQTLYQKYGKYADPWMTLVGYFNTTRELGGTVTLLRDDIAALLKETPKYGLVQRWLSESSHLELTSRIDTHKIKDILQKLDFSFDPVNDQLRKEAVERAKETGEAYDGPPRPADVVLATNMISVGVDIDRLGLMVVTRQPKTTAEYIQASSRVGRSGKAPGLVLTLYNWAHPRDLSHYEVFEHYHETFYKHVEANSVTPFSSRALDRGLSALLISLVRLSGTRYNANLQANELDEHDPLLKNIIDTIAQRASDVRNQQALEQEVRNALKKRLDEWLMRIQQMPLSQKTLGYKTAKGNVDGLLHGAESLDPENPGRTAQWEVFTCLNSLRNVEPQIPLVISQPHREIRERPPYQHFIPVSEKEPSK